MGCLKIRTSEVKSNEDDSKVSGRIKKRVCVSTTF